MAASENEEMFKTTLMGGFDKDDVLRQVQAMKEKADAKETKLLEDLKNKETTIEELTSKVASKEAEIEKLERNIQEKYQSYIDNYDMISQLVFDAKVRSETMLREAGEKSEKIVSEAETTARERLESVQKEVDEKLSDGRKKYLAVQEELNTIVELINEAQRRFMQSYKSVHAIVSSMSESCHELGDELEDDLDEGITDALQDEKE